MTRTFSRRHVLKTLAYAGALSPLVMPRLVRAVSPNSRLNLASIGCAGKGWEDLISSSGDGKLHNVVALCDIDHRSGGVQPGNLGKAQAARPLGIGAAAEKFPSARRYADFRKALEQKGIDALTISTPDHMHATIAITAMLLGKHVYVQKPLTHTVHEARVIRQVARRAGVVTQMGNQFHSGVGYRTVVKLIESGVIGKVTEAHAWTSSPNWPQGITTPPGEDPVPTGVHWDLWIGVARPRPYKQHVYHNFNWRGWQEFGSGALGDMGCHIIDPVYWALELTSPRSVFATGTGANDQTYPQANTVTYIFPATRHTAGDLKLTWYDGGHKVDEAITMLPKGHKLPSSGSLFIGEKGVLLAPHGPAAPRLFPEDPARIAIVRDTYKTFEAQDHYRMWTDAILANKPANSHFDYAGPLTETVMIGTIAQRLPGRQITWDAQAMTFNDAAATALVRKSYRKEFAISELA